MNAINTNTFYFNETIPNFPQKKVVVFTCKVNKSASYTGYSELYIVITMVVAF